MSDQPTLQPPDPDATLDPPAAGTVTLPPVAERVGRYEVRGELGEGSFGVVYRAYDPQLDREVALKVAKAFDNPSKRDRFRREAKAAAGLRHPNIVPLYEAGEADGRAYLASAYIDGTTLHDALGEKPMDPRRAAELVRKLADAVAYAHSQGVIHRDVKSSNVMLDAAGEPHLLDFGLARRLEDSAVMTQDGTVLGTPAYLAPEVCRGEANRWSPAADQYALGVLLYELLTGRVPFEGPTAVVLALHQTQEPATVSTMNPAVPRDLEAVCRRCLEKDPGRRYGGCADLAHDLGKWGEGLPTAARPLSVGERLRRWAGRNRALATAVTAAAVFLVGGAVTSASYAVQANRLVRQLDAATQQRATTVRRIIKFFRHFPEAGKLSDDELTAKFLDANRDLTLEDFRIAVRPTSLVGTEGGNVNPNMFAD